MKQTPTIRTPLKTARGLGSARDGTHHFWLERLSALALVPLSVWFIIEFISVLMASDRASVALWFHAPLSALLMAVFVGALFFHSKLGIQVIIEDYVHCEAKKLGMLVFSSAVHLLCGAACLVAIAHLHFIGI